jgi:AcrR family transcriptional regulator
MTKKDSRTAGEKTRDRITEAALTTLKKEGFAGATSRAIAREGGFNQALIFYHFGSLDGLLLAALDQTSEERLERYREAVDKAETPEELAEVAVTVYAEDRDRGHMTVVSQMVAGSVARPELAGEVVARMEPWIELCEDALRKALSNTPAAEVVPLRDLAYAVVTFYLGLNLLTHLDQDRERTEAVVARLESLAPLLAQG